MFNKKIFYPIILIAIISRVNGQSQIDYLFERVLLEQALFTENYEVRQTNKRAIESSTIEELDFKSREIEQTGNKLVVKMYVWKEPTTFKLIFANDTKKLGIDRFSAHSRGNYVFQKRLDTGAIDYLRVFLQDDGLSYLEIKSDGHTRSKMDIYISGTPIYRNIKIPMNFISVATSPLARVMASTKSMVDWPAILPHAGWDDWQKIKLISAKIDPYLPYLAKNDIEDGAQDATGRFIFIENGKLQNDAEAFRGGFNCSGFAKWVADAIYAPLNSGKLMDPEVIKKPPMLRKTESLSNGYPERDPYFGLDWVRNIAYQIAHAQYPYKRLSYDSMDVNDIPFINYIPDVGYSLNNLEAILYLQAIRYPNSFYIASINKEFGSNPPLRQHVHTVVFFPFFDKNGNFTIKVYDRNRATTPDGLRSQYIGGYVHLERIEAAGDFILPALN